MACEREEEEEKEENELIFRVYCICTQTRISTSGINRKLLQNFKVLFRSFFFLF